MLKKILVASVLCLAMASSFGATKPTKPKKPPVLPYTGYQVAIRDANGNFVTIQSTYSTLAQCLVAAAAIRNTIVEGDTTTIQPATSDVSVYCYAVEVFPPGFG